MLELKTLKTWFIKRFIIFKTMRNLKKELLNYIPSKYINI